MKVVIRFNYSTAELAKLIKEHPKTYLVEKIEALPYNMQLSNKIIHKHARVIVANFNREILYKIAKINKLNDKMFKEERILDKKYEALRKPYFDQIRAFEINQKGENK